MHLYITQFLYLLYRKRPNPFQASLQDTPYPAAMREIADNQKALESV